MQDSTEHLTKKIDLDNCDVINFNIDPNVNKDL